MKTMHLFAGAGGGLLADLILGHEPIAAIEWDAYCCRVLRERAAEGWFPGLRVYEGDVRLFDPSEYEGRVDCIHAGFPCQDISAAGSGVGIDGPKSGLWREVMRAIDAIRPRFIFFENSPRIRTKGRDRIIAEIVARGYAWRDGIIGAADVGAPHQRDRWFCIAANSDGLRELQSQGRERDERGWSYHKTENDADLMRERRSHGSWVSTAEKGTHFRASAYMGAGQRPDTNGASWFKAEPDVGRLVYGVAPDLVPNAVKALGNGQVPLQAAAAWRLLGGP